MMKNTLAPSFSRVATKRSASLALAFGMACSLLTPGCVTRPQIRPTSPFTAAMARDFDDSVDYVFNLEDIGGHQAQEIQRQLDALARTSDVIALARIETVTVSQDTDGQQSYRLIAHVQELLTGTVPEDNRVPLRASQGQPGYNTVSGRQDRLQAGNWVLFVKWYTDGANEVRPHWHLSPQSDGLLARVRDRAGLTTQTQGNFRVVQSGRNPPMQVTDESEEDNSSGNGSGTTPTPTPTPQR